MNATWAPLVRPSGRSTRPRHAASGYLAARRANLFKSSTVGGGEVQAPSARVDVEESSHSTALRLIVKFVDPGITWPPTLAYRSHCEPSHLNTPTTLSPAATNKLSNVAARVELQQVLQAMFTPVSREVRQLTPGDSSSLGGGGGGNSVVLETDAQFEVAFGLLLSVARTQRRCVVEALSPLKSCDIVISPTMYSWSGSTLQSVPVVSTIRTS